MSDASAGGWAAMARRLAAALLDIASTRADLALTELSEERLRLVRQLWLYALALLSGLLALVWLGLALADWAGPERRAAVLAGLGLVMAAAAFGCARRAGREWAERPPLLDATLTELRRDAAALRGEEPR